MGYRTLDLRSELHLGPLVSYFEAGTHKVAEPGLELVIISPQPRRIFKRIPRPNCSIVRYPAYACEMRCRVALGAGRTLRGPELRTKDPRRSWGLTVPPRPKAKPVAVFKGGLGDKAAATLPRLHKGRSKTRRQPARPTTCASLSRPPFSGKPRSTARATSHLGRRPLCRDNRQDFAVRTRATGYGTTSGAMYQGLTLAHAQPAQ